MGIGDRARARALGRVPGPVLDGIGTAVLTAVDEAVERRWDQALARAEAAPGLTLDQRVDAVSRRFSRELTRVGAVSGAAAAIPGVGTAVAASALGVDLAWFALRSTDLIMTIGALNGRTAAAPEERRAWVLSVLAFGEQAADQAGLLLDDVAASSRGGERVASLLAGVAGGDVAALDAVRRLNTTMASRVVTRFGTRKGLLGLGRLVPFGVGAAVGGGVNWALMRTISRQASKLFADYRLGAASGTLAGGRGTVAPPALERRSR
ncbi:MAG: hypothetical protein ACK5PP_03575 [Acidimicrobiales bacterium]